MTSGRESLFLNLVTWSQNESWGDFDQWFSFNPGIGRKKNSNVVAQNSNLIEILTSHIQKVGSLVGKKARGLEFLLDMRAGICSYLFCCNKCCVPVCRHRHIGMEMEHL
jgi:hypothetical protein